MRGLANNIIRVFIYAQEALMAEEKGSLGPIAPEANSI